MICKIHTAVLLYFSQAKFRLLSVHRVCDVYNKNTLCVIRVVISSSVIYPPFPTLRFYALKGSNEIAITKPTERVVWSSTRSTDSSATRKSRTTAVIPRRASRSYGIVACTWRRHRVVTTLSTLSAKHRIVESWVHAASHTARPRQTTTEVRSERVIWTETRRVKVVMTQASWQPAISQSTSRRSIDFVLVLKSGYGLGEWPTRHPRLR